MSNLSSAGLYSVSKLSNVHWASRRVDQNITKDWRWTLLDSVDGFNTNRPGPWTGFHGETMVSLKGASLCFVMFSGAGGCAEERADWKLRERHPRHAGPAKCVRCQAASQGHERSGYGWGRPGGDPLHCHQCCRSHQNRPTIRQGCDYN